MPSVYQPSLAGGELAPSLQGRTDLARYGSSLATCRNIIIRPYGGGVNRSGSQFVAYGKSPSSRVRLIPFNYSTEQSYVLEFGSGYMRVILNDGVSVGNVALSAQPIFWVTATNYAQGSKVRNGSYNYYCTSSHTSAAAFATDLSNGKWWQLADLVFELPTPYPESALRSLVFTQKNDVMTFTHPDYAPMQLKRYAHDDWRLVPFDYQNGPFLDQNTDVSRMIYMNKTVGSVTLSVFGVRLFETYHIDRLFRVELRDFGSSWEPGKAVIMGQIYRSDAKYYKVTKSGTTGTNRPTHIDGTWSDGAVSWVYQHSGYGVCRIKTVATDGLSATADVVEGSRLPSGAVIATPSVFAVLTPPYIAISTSGNIRATSTAHGAPVGASGLAVLATSYTSTGADGYTTKQIYRVASYTYVDANTLEFSVPFPTDFVSHNSGNFSVLPNGETSSSTYKWSFGAWGKRGGSNDPANLAPGWPRCSTYHQQRQVFAGTYGQPQTLWTSKTGDFQNFNREQAVLDDDSVVFTVVASDVNAIRQMRSMSRLMLMTSGGPWVVGSGQQTDVLTPGNIGVTQQSATGVSELPVLGIGTTSVYVQDLGSIVSDLSYEFASDNYVGDDLTLPGSHLLEHHSIVEWAYQEAPFKVIWAVRDDGVLLGCTYMKRQQVNGWHRHDTNGTYESVCCIREGAEDVVYVAVLRMNGSGQPARHIERFASRSATSDPASWVFLDSAIRGGDIGLVSYDSSSGLLTSSWPQFTIDDVGRAFWFNGYTVLCTDVQTSYRIEVTTGSAVSVVGAPCQRIAQVYTAGNLYGTVYALTYDGTVLGPFTANGTVDIGVSQPVLLGYAYQQDIETLAVDFKSQETLRDRAKTIPNVTLLLQDTAADLTVGPNSSNLFPMDLTIGEGYDPATKMLTGTVECAVLSSWTVAGKLFIRNISPKPVSIIGIVPEVVIGA